MLLPCAAMCATVAPRDLLISMVSVWNFFLTLEIAKVKIFSYLDPLTGVDPRISRTLSESLNDEVQRHVGSSEMYHYILIDQFTTVLF